MKLNDKQYMDMALRMGRRHMGATAQNPSVGCIIVKNGDIVGRGVTARGGRPHAEVQALAQAGSSASGADVYVTLEPCAHHGKTPPCCDALIDAQVRRVVTALEDPDARTAGSGHQRLLDAGIEMATGVCSHGARRDLAGFLSRIRRGRPHVTLKLAVSRDGMITAARGQRTSISGPEALRRSQMMRAQADAIMIGAETLRIDDPVLTCRLAGLEDTSPVRVVICSDVTVLKGTQLVRSASIAPVWVLTGDAGQLEGVEVISCGKTADGLVNLAEGLNALGQRGIGRLIVEGGAMLARSFLEQRLVDEVALFQAPHSIGAKGIAAPLDLIESKQFKIRDTVLLGVDRLSVYDLVN